MRGCVLFVILVGILLFAAVVGILIHELLAALDDLLNAVTT